MAQKDNTAVVKSTSNSLLIALPKETSIRAGNQICMNLGQVGEKKSVSSESTVIPISSVNTSVNSPVPARGGPPLMPSHSLPHREGTRHTIHLSSASTASSKLNRTPLPASHNATSTSKLPTVQHHQVPVSVKKKTPRFILPKSAPIPRSDNTLISSSSANAISNALANFTKLQNGPIQTFIHKNTSDIQSRGKGTASVDRNIPIVKTTHGNVSILKRTVQITDMNNLGSHTEVEGIESQTVVPEKKLKFTKSIFEPEAGNLPTQDPITFTCDNRKLMNIEDPIPPIENDLPKLNSSINTSAAAINSPIVAKPQLLVLNQCTNTVSRGKLTNSSHGSAKMVTANSNIVSSIYPVESLPSYQTNTGIEDTWNKLAQSVVNNLNFARSEPITNHADSVETKDDHLMKAGPQWFWDTVRKENPVEDNPDNHDDAGSLIDEKISETQSQNGETRHLSDEKDGILTEDQPKESIKIEFEYVKIDPESIKPELGTKEDIIMITGKDHDYSILGGNGETKHSVDDAIFVDELNVEDDLKREDSDGESPKEVPQKQKHCTPCKESWEEWSVEGTEVIDLSTEGEDSSCHFENERNQISELPEFDDKSCLGEQRICDSSVNTHHLGSQMDFANLLQEYLPKSENSNILKRSSVVTSMTRNFGTYMYHWHNYMDTIHSERDTYFNSKYLPCPFCLCCTLQEPNHVCEVEKASPGISKVFRNNFPVNATKNHSQLILLSPFNLSFEQKMHVCNKLSFPIDVVEDPLIMAISYFHMRQYVVKKYRNCWYTKTIKSSVGYLKHILKELQKVARASGDSLLSLEDILQARHLTKWKEVLQTFDDGGDYNFIKSSQMATISREAMRTILILCCQLLRGKAVRENDPGSFISMTDFMESLSRPSIDEIVPGFSYVVKFAEEQRIHIIKLIASLSENINYAKFAELSIQIMLRTILFNGFVPQSQFVEKFLASYEEFVVSSKNKDYQMPLEAMKKSNECTCIKNTNELNKDGERLKLNESCEKSYAETFYDILSKRLPMMPVPGCTSCHLLLPPDVTAALRTLLRVKNSLKINIHEPYLMTPNGTPLTSYDVIEINKKVPNSTFMNKVFSEELRQMNSVIYQLQELDKEEVDDLYNAGTKNLLHLPHLVANSLQERRKVIMEIMNPACMNLNNDILLHVPGKQKRCAGDEPEGSDQRQKYSRPASEGNKVEGGSMAWDHNKTMNMPKLFIGKWTSEEIEELYRYLGKFINCHVESHEHHAKLAAMLSKQNGGQLYRRPLHDILRKTSLLRQKNSLLNWDPAEIDEIKECFKYHIAIKETPGQLDIVQVLDLNVDKNGQLCKRQWFEVKSMIMQIIQSSYGEEIDIDVPARHGVIVISNCN